MFWANKNSLCLEFFKHKQHLDFSMLVCYRNLYQEKWADNEIIYEYCVLYQQVDYWRHWSTPYWYQAVVESAYRVILSPWLVLKLRKLKFLDCVEDCRVNCEQFKCSSGSLCGDLRPIYSNEEVAEISGLSCNSSVTRHGSCIQPKLNRESSYYRHFLLL